MAAGFGAAVIFYALLIAEVMLALFTVCFASHNFLAVLQETAAGSDDIDWPDEPIQDWLPRGAYLVGLIAIILAPIGFARVVLRSSGVTENVLIPLLISAATLLWLAFPICILSSLSGSSRVFIVRAKVLAQLGRIPGALALQYLASAFLFTAVIGLGYATFVAGWYWFLPVTALAATVALLIYARLLGRLAWLINELGPVKKASEKKAPPPPGVRAEVMDAWGGPEKKRKRKKRKRESSAHIPTQLPVEGYEMSEAPPANPPSGTPLDGFPAIGEETFDVGDAPAVPPEEGTEPPSIPYTERLEYQLAIKSQRPQAPDYPMVSGVYSFPWYKSSQRVLVMITAGLFLMGGIFMLMKFPGD
jgi:hypothetical protein